MFPRSIVYLFSLHGALEKSRVQELIVVSSGGWFCAAAVPSSERMIYKRTFGFLRVAGAGVDCVHASMRLRGTTKMLLFSFIFHKTGACQKETNLKFNWNG